MRGKTDDETIISLKKDDEVLVNELIQRVRPLLARADMKARDLDQLRMLMAALEKLPQATPDLSIALTLALECGREMNYQELAVNDCSLRLSSGGIAYSPVAGTDTYCDIIFEAETGGHRDHRGMFAIMGWLEAWSERVGDREQKVTVGAS